MLRASQASQMLKSASSSSFSMRSGLNWLQPKVTAMKTITATMGTSVVNPNSIVLRRSKNASKRPAVTGFDHLIDSFAQHGITLVPSIGRNRKWSYVLIRDGQVRQLSSLSELSLILWAIGDIHA